ncbi:N-acyl-D-amino-acid deacylase family protein [Microbacterium immunditiarum]|uniref:N-acyl-D-amino-acid deacylase n=1 Tax=Microbacterium immunditiarum TaxID=337480 RepID=A0A7Y9KI03_9MICO|nr:amidohydrolase family protein [Microbacterium immunditiarum]NYE18081.1 N-acyl-D-amino-acid deacylase [Microbacterium immunditiarum]
MTDFDILIEGGEVVIGSPPTIERADVGVKDGRIGAVRSSLAGATADRRIDARDLLVSPGFIDPHSHTDWTVLINPAAQSTIRQGVTTEIVGNCGVTLAPVSPSSSTSISALLKSFGYTGTIGWLSLADLFDEIAGEGTSQNLAWFVGHSAIRDAAGVRGPRVDATQTRRMQRLLAESLDAGALGMSTGLEYGSGRDASTEELLALAQTLHTKGAGYASHIRNRDASIDAAVDEFFSIAHAADHLVQLSHLNVRAGTGAADGAWERAAQRVVDERQRGLRVLADFTPFSNGIGLAEGLMPGWFLTMSASERSDLLSSPEGRARLKDDTDRYWRFLQRGEWGRVSFSVAPGRPWYEGRQIDELAADLTLDPWDVFFDAVAAAGADLGALQLIGDLFTPEHMREAISHDHFLLGVDGYSTVTEGVLGERTRTHPLFYAGHVHYLAYHALSNRTLSIEDAIHKMSGRVADHFAIQDRGYIATGLFADLAVIDLRGLRSLDTTSHKGTYVDVVPYVLVNGVLTVDQRVHTGARAGRLLTR